MLFLPVANIREQDLECGTKVGGATGMKMEGSGWAALKPGEEKGLQPELGGSLFRVPGCGESGKDFCPH